ncbi:hypothetical protein ACFYV7_34995 [Nocardia suismassiliense]|uniref:Uncharacterized protein n=1 Tax=Nocardia suismassiliense TaxID=2077092 RepID=A0ABW6R5J1_9NOCA
MSEPDRPSPGQRPSTALPTAYELLDAMHDVVPERHPAAPILRAACLLAAVDEWIHRHRAAIEASPPTSRRVNGPGIERAARTLRRYLIEGIADAAPGIGDIGNAVDELARAWVDWRDVSTGDDLPHQVDTHQALIAACAAYDKLAGHDRYET